VGWSDGDYNYDGQINRNDVSLLASSYVFQGAPLGDAITPGQAQYMLALDPDMPANVQATFDAIAAGETPEPASLGLLGGAGLLTLTRRRRRSRQ
jgi:PEP-CTERM motif-containing protein